MMQVIIEPDQEAGFSKMSIFHQHLRALASFPKELAVSRSTWI
jgi:hypothetical protein